MKGDPPLFSKLRAAKAYYDFTGHKPKSVTRSRLDKSPVAGYRMGDVVGIAYEARRDGKTDQYFHRFKKRVRPELVARSDGKQLYISGGKYRVTDRGIEDMPTLFTINPSKRRRASSSRTRRRTKKGLFMRNPRRRRRVSHRRRRHVVSYAANPRRRRRRRSSVLGFRANPVRRRRRRSYLRNPRRRRGFRRNPDRMFGSVFGVIMPAVVVGAGAVGTEIMMGYLPIPASWKTGPIKYAVKGAVALVAGALIAKFASRKVGEAFAAGGVAIAAHDAIRAAITNYAPSVQFGSYNWNKYGYRVPLAQNFPSLGYYSPGQTLGMRGMGAYVQTPRGMHGYRVPAESGFRA